MTLVALLAMTTGAWATEEYESFDLSSGNTNVNGTHFNITGTSGMNDYGLFLSSESVTVTSLNGENITRVEFIIGLGKSKAENITGTPGTNSCTNGNENGSITDINATSVTLSTENSGYTSVSIKQITVYYGNSEPAVEVTTNAASEGATFTEASFNMPAFDATAEYELVRDMTVSVIPVIADRIRIKKDGTTYVPVTATELVPVITDELDEQNPVTMVLYDETDKTGDYTVKLQKKVEGDTPSWTDATALSVGTFRYVITGANLYDGEITTTEFQLFEGYEVTIPAGEYITYYRDEPLKLDDNETYAELYTISAVGTETATATELTIAKANMPILVKNTSEEAKTILLIPTVDDADEVTAAEEFVGTLEATTIAASTSELTNYAFNGKQFVWVKDAIEVAANKAWLAIPTGEATARTITLVFGDATGVNAANSQQPTANSYYDLNGRKLNGIPTKRSAEGRLYPQGLKKGVYIMNGRKVVIK